RDVTVRNECVVAHSIVVDEAGAAECSSAGRVHAHVAGLESSSAASGPRIGHRAPQVGSDTPMGPDALLVERDPPCGLVDVAGRVAAGLVGRDVFEAHSHAGAHSVTSARRARMRCWLALMSASIPVSGRGGMYL